MASPRVLWFPPSGQNSPFDSHQWQDHGHYLKNRKLAWSDLDHMHLQKVGDRRPARKRLTPDWALQNEKFREVILCYLEARLCVRDSSGTNATRLARCRAKAVADLPSKQQRLEAWIEEYRMLVRAAKSDAAKVKILEQCIRGLDSEISVMPRLPEVVTSAAFCYYRLFWNSPTVAESLGICAPAVRQLLSRMNKLGEKLWPETLEWGE